VTIFGYLSNIDTDELTPIVEDRRLNAQGQPKNKEWRETRLLENGRRHQSRTINHYRR